MQTEIEFAETAGEASNYFADEQRAFDYIKLIRWSDGIVRCPRCQCEHVSFVSTRRLWTCKACKTKKQFTLRVGTIFEDSPMKFNRWISVVWLIANAKKRISSYELADAVGVCQKTGWSMLQRIRLAMYQSSSEKRRGVVADKTYIAVKARCTRKDRRAGVSHARAKKTPAKGILEGGTNQPSRQSSSEPTPFQQFDALMRRVIKVPKAVVDRRAKAAKKQRQHRSSKQ